MSHGKRLTTATKNNRTIITLGRHCNIVLCCYWPSEAASGSFNFSRVIHRSAISGSYSNCMFNFIRNCQDIFQSAGIIPGLQEFQLLHMLADSFAGTGLQFSPVIFSNIFPVWFVYIPLFLTTPHLFFSLPQQHKHNSHGVSTKDSSEYLNSWGTTFTMGARTLQSYLSKSKGNLTRNRNGGLPGNFPYGRIF